MATVRQFLEVLFPELHESFIEVRLIKPDHVLPPTFYESIEQLLNAMPQGIGEQNGFNVYFGACLRSRRDGKKDAVKLVWSLWVDLDAKAFGGGKSEALKRLREFPLSPTAIVDSGHGYHAYWRLKEPEEIHDPSDVVRIEAYLKALTSALGGDRQAAELARVLRLPATYNVKVPSAPVLVTIVELNPSRQYNLSEFESLPSVTAYTAPSHSPSSSDAADNSQSWVQKLLIGCKFFKWATAHQADVSEPLWFAVASNCAPFDSGREQFHRFSREYPTYKAEEADRKFDHAGKDTGPHSCRYIQEQGFDCTGCPWKDKIISPAALAHKDVELPGMIESLQPEQLRHLQEVVSHIAQVPSPLEREVYLKTIAAKKVGYSLGTLRQELVRLTAKTSQPEEDGDSEKVRFSAVFPGLVDIAEHQGQIVYLVKVGEQLVIQSEAVIEGVRYLPPPKDQIPWLLPRAEEVLRHYEEQRTQGEAADAMLFDDLRAYHQGISDLPDERHYDLLTSWDFHTYLVERCLFSPIICFFAVPERGKSRTGKGMIYVAYRGVHVETLREANLIRLATHWRATLFFDVMDLWKKAERNESEDVILHRFERGVRIARVLYPERGAHQDTVFFEPFGATVISTNENVHHILETRSIQITMPESAKRFELEVTPEAALPLKERLLAFRARYLGQPFLEIAKPASGRLGDILKPLCQVMCLVRPERIKEFLELIEDLEAQRRMDRSEGLEASILSAIVRSAAEVRGGVLPVKTITDALNAELPERSRFSTRKVGWRLKALGMERARMNDGSRGIRWNEVQLRTLCQKYGVELTPEMPETSN